MLYGLLTILAIIVLAPVVALILYGLSIILLAVGVKIIEEIRNEFS